MTNYEKFLVKLLSKASDILAWESDICEEYSERGCRWVYGGDPEPCTDLFDSDTCGPCAAAMLMAKIDEVEKIEATN